MRNPDLKPTPARLAKLAFAIVAAWPSIGRAEIGNAAFAKRAMHLLRDHCVLCHNAKKTKGDLNLTTRELALKGGGEGPALLSGQAVKSRMIQFLQPDSDPHMPPKKQLSAEEIDALSQWIDAGAE